jgi:hypothetical protein
MRKAVAIAALAAGLAGPASAATLDFTANDATTGMIGNVTWNVWSATIGDMTGLTQSRHYNNAGCAPFVCQNAPLADPGNPYDVGFGIVGNGNDNEIDPREFVTVTFDAVVKLSGFAGMLTYFNRNASENFETVRLEYRDGDGNWQLAADADAEFPGPAFDTVGLAISKKLWILTNAVRFSATGEGTSDDKSFNVTAAALHVAPVPVPASLPLLLAGIGALGWAARRKRKSA